MKKMNFKKALIAVVALISCANVSAKGFNPETTTGEGTVAYVVTTDGQGNIASVAPMQKDAEAGAYSWHIRDLSGYTNIRSSPNGKVCMRLKAWTNYAIYARGENRGWLSISQIYNETEGYWVRLHSSKTGTYWIAKSILY